MNKLYYLAPIVGAAMLASVATCARADDDTTAGSAEKANADSNGAWQKTKDAADAAGGAVENGAKKVGGAIKDGAVATGHGIKEGAEAAGRATKKVAKKGANALGLNNSQKQREAAFRRHEQGEHEMSGHIVAVDHQTGHVVVKTDDANLNLHFVKDVLAKVDKGQAVTVQLAFAKLPLPTGDAAANEEHTRAYDAPANDQFTKTAHWMTGTIDKIDHEKGLIQLTAEKGIFLKVHFPPADVRELNQGDRIAVELALSITPAPANIGDARPTR